MNYIKAKFPNSTRSYTYRTVDSVKAGDTVVNAKGAKLTVTDESVDMKWVETYGADKMSVVKKYEEQEDTYNTIKAIEAQAKLCEEKGYPHFAPINGVCWKCNRQIYQPAKIKCYSGEEIERPGISVERASRELITGCPHCNWSYCE